VFTAPARVNERLASASARRQHPPLNSFSNSKQPLLQIYENKSAPGRCVSPLNTGGSVRRTDDANGFWSAEKLVAITICRCERDASLHHRLDGRSMEERRDRCRHCPGQQGRQCL